LPVPRHAVRTPAYVCARLRTPCAQGRGWRRVDGDAREVTVPFDPHGADEDDLDPKDVGGRERRFKDFDCPVCNANNPYDDAFGDGDEIRCFYCGQELEVSVTDGGRLKLRET